MPRLSVDELVRKAGLFLAVACALMVIGSLLVLAVPSLRELVQPADNAPAYTIGERVDLPEDVFVATPRTLLIFARNTCAGCQRARSFFADVISTIMPRGGWSAKLIGTGAFEDENVLYAESVGIDSHDVLSAPDSLRLKEVPTLLVVDSTGRILVVFEGPPTTPLNRAELLAAVLASEQRP